MKKWSRQILIGVLMLVCLTSACSSAMQTPALPTGTSIPYEQIGSPSLTATGVISVTETSTPATDVIPITGENVVEMQCQFCVNDRAHAVFIFPDSAIFDVEAGSPVTCLTAEVVNGKRVLVCNGAQSTSFNLKICSDASNCLLFPVALQPCPLTVTGTQVTTVTPVFLTAINTLFPPSRTPRPRTPVASEAPTQTGVVPTSATSTEPPAEATATSAPPPADTSTSEPPPPPPTQPADTPAPPAPTSEAPNDHRPSTHTPRP